LTEEELGVRTADLTKVTYSTPWDEDRPRAIKEFHGLAPWEFEFPVPVSLISTFLGRETMPKVDDRQLFRGSTRWSAGR